MNLVQSSMKKEKHKSYDYKDKRQFSKKHYQDNLADMLVTSFDKVLIYLKEVKGFISSLEIDNCELLNLENDKKHHIDKINWVIETIQSQTLYQYEPGNIANLQDKEDEDLVSLIGFLDSYSTNARRNSQKKFPTVSNSKKNQRVDSEIDIHQFHSFREMTAPNENFNIKVSKPKVKTEKIDQKESNDKYFNFASALNEDCSNEEKKDSELENSREENINSTVVFPNIPKFSIQFENKFQENIHLLLDKNFNIFSYTKEVGDMNLLSYIVRYDLTNFDSIMKDVDKSQGSILSLLNIDKITPFSAFVREKYLKKPYHNHIHGTDVFHTLFHLLYFSKFISILSLNALDIVSMLLAGLLHDIGHPGFNNSFMINSKSDLAYIYNDIHVLENFHCAEGFKAFSNNSTNILNLDSYQIKNFRKRFIQMILSTDPMSHSKIVSLIKNKALINDIIYGNNAEKLMNQEARKFDDQQEVLDFLISFADTSHSCKPFEVTFKWTSLLIEEFWHQGDVEKELNLPISFLCDRKDAYVGKGQIGFIQAIIMPGVNLIINISPSLIYLKENLEQNIEKWKDYLESRQN